MRLEHIYRHPVKGLTPERLAASVLQQGAGIPFDRACGFTSGNLPDPPVAGGWVPARTFIQLTVYPELARFRARLDETHGRLTFTSPAGESAEALLGDAAGAAAANALIARHFAAGPHGVSALHVQAQPKGHWDFTDTGISILNLASLRVLEQVAGVTIDARRFRANLHVDGLQPWAEFGLMGGRYRLGGAVIDVTRPAMRCAATTADPDTGDTGLNVPALLRKATGHLFFAVYGRVIETGAVRPGDRLERLADSPASPLDNLPPRTPDPRQWPRVFDATVEGRRLRLTSPLAGWPLPQATAGDQMMLHPGLGYAGPFTRLTVESAGTDAIVVALPDALTPGEQRLQLIASGPRSREETA
jgi:uncharacterized protein YcbX